jgi:hypothetical protein
MVLGALTITIAGPPREYIRTEANPQHVNKTWLLYFDSTGHDIGRKEFPYSMECSSSIQTSDGGFAFFGTLSPLRDSTGRNVGSFKNGRKPFLINADAEQSVLWTRDYPSKSVEFSHGTGFVQLPGGGFLLLGYDLVLHGDMQYWIRRVDGQGKEMSYRTLNGISGAHLVTVGPGRFLLIGENRVTDDQNQAGSGSHWTGVIAELNGDGTTLWKTELGDQGENNIMNACATQDGGYIGVGYADGAGPGGHAAWVIKVDAHGTLVWEKKWREGTFCEFNSVESNAGRYLAHGVVDRGSVTVSFDETGSQLRTLDADTNSIETGVKREGSCAIVSKTREQIDDSTFMFHVQVDSLCALSFQQKNCCRQRDFMVNVFCLPGRKFLVTGFSQVRVWPPCGK